MNEISSYRRFSSEHDYMSFSVVRIHTSILKTLGGRNTWVKISSSKSSIYRLALGAKPSKGFIKSSIEIDYDSCVELSCISADYKDENNFYACSIKIEKAGFLGKFIAHWKHPNPAYRIPMQVSLLSFSLGIAGLILGIGSFI